MSSPDHSLDAFLGGQLALEQPRQGYRAGVDPVLLAASVPARAGQSVLDMGCGVGAAALCLATRVAGLQLAGLEIQPHYAELARANGCRAGQDFEVFTGDVTAPPPELRQMSFDHVITNPPYFDRAAGTVSPDPARERAMGRGGDIADWLGACFKRVKPRGWFHMIYRTEYLPHLFAASLGGMGSWTICPLAPRVGRPAELMILHGRKDGRKPLRLLPAVVLHRGARHERDGDDYTDHIRAVLRDGAALET